jgi:hypothetical protein
VIEQEEMEPHGMEKADGVASGSGFRLGQDDDAPVRTEAGEERAVADEVEGRFDDGRPSLGWAVAGRPGRRSSNPLKERALAHSGDLFHDGGQGFVGRRGIGGLRHARKRVAAVGLAVPIAVRQVWVGQQPGFEEVGQAVSVLVAAQGGEREIEEESFGCPLGRRGGQRKGEPVRVGLLSFHFQAQVVAVERGEVGDRAHDIGLIDPEPGKKRISPGGAAVVGQDQPVGADRGFTDRVQRLGLHDRGDSLSFLADVDDAEAGRQVGAPRLFLQSCLDLLVAQTDRLDACRERVLREDRGGRVGEEAGDDRCRRVGPQGSAGCRFRVPGLVFDAQQERLSLRFDLFPDHPQASRDVRAGIDVRGPVSQNSGDPVQLESRQGGIGFALRQAGVQQRSCQGPAAHEIRSRFGQQVEPVVPG